jgi:hypothetical protein
MATYEQTLLVYLDIMGFKDMIEESAADPTKIDLIIQTLRRMRRQAEIKMPGVHGAKTKTKTQSFSDLIVRATYPQPSQSLIQQISAECWLLAAVQGDLVVSHGVLLRGGMCLSHLYMDDDLVFGPALVTSYQLGEHVAMFPRIVIDPAIMAVEKQNPMTDLSNTFIGRGEDGAYFLDYLYTCFRHPTILLGFPGPVEMFEGHKRRAESKLAELSKKGERAKQKALWLALYHNSVLNRLMRQHRKMKPKLSSLLIPEELLRV